MSKENIQSFFESLQEDSKEQEQILTAPDLSTLSSTTVKLGRDAGYEFTEEEFDSFLTEIDEAVQPPEELSEEDLESVAGGDKVAQKYSRDAEEIFKWLGKVPGPQKISFKVGRWSAKLQCWAIKKGARPTHSLSGGNFGAVVCNR